MKQLRQILLLSFALLVMGSSAYAQKSGGAACNIFIPNAFTPNGDNINERFVVKSGENCDIMEFHMQVFDRWGRMVYEVNSQNPSVAWDGTFDGKELQQGVYMWSIYVRYRSLNNSIGEEKLNKQGTVILIR